ncbi:hypothetical protein ABL78_7385 [Leptomonas seymouri]|uniref:Uncharacterized protein n=1 Tax=Leptomonas seymouri TaxID=5684 RepID=A0A0N1IH86_LEPSE|nr:hypothetical protein ABL78_7385 [Leptomonas seymouri]|eukprot:KPI83582.1 hypothetical protein ABL78_7385 [Leptomonas seymouri]
MDAAWQSSIDRTLRSTEATLENLQERRRSYERAKHKVDDYLGLATPHRSSKGFDSIDGMDLSIPPPLPQHRRYRTTCDGVVNDGAASTGGAGAPSSSPSVHRSAQASQPSVMSTANGRRDDDPTAPLQLVNAQLRGAMLELELEKAKRADSIRDLAYRTTAELAELRSMFTQLQSENASLRKSVRALEGKLSLAPDSTFTSQRMGEGGASVLNSRASHTSFMELGPQPQHTSRSALLASSVANSGFGLGPDATTAASGAPASLIARIDALEGGFARLQQVAEERQTRSATVLREMVKAEVGSDMAQVRTLAREAARDSTEELLKLRLSALQSSVQTEVQRALRVASASETAAQQAQQQCAEVERRLSAQMQKINAPLFEWQRGALSGPLSADAARDSSSVATSAAPARQERLIELERVVEDELHTLRGQLRQLRQETETHLERHAQEHKQMQAQLQGKASAQDLRGVMERLEEQQQSGSGSGAALREQVHSILRTQLLPLQDTLQKLQEGAREQQENAEVWRRQAGLRLAAVEASTREFRDEADRQDQQWNSGMQELRQVRVEAAAVQAGTTDALRQCKAELMEMCDTKLQTLEERLLVSQKDRQHQWEAQLRQLQQSVGEQHELAQRARFAGETAEERLHRVESAVASMESALPHSIENMKAKHDALQAVLQQSCALPLSRVQQDVEGIQRRLHALDEDKTRSNAVWAQQLADTKQFFEEHMQNTRSMLEQRLSHQKELYEELRGQQGVQRRNTEEQQQLVLDQVQRLQQQLQLLASNSLTPLPAPAAATTRSEPTGQSVSATLTEERSVPTAVTTAVPVTAEAFHELQQQVRQLYPQLQNVDQRVMATEKAAAAAPTALTDAFAPLQGRFEELQARAQRDAEEQQLRLSEMERTLSEKVRVVSLSCNRLSASAEGQLGRVRDELASATSPLRLATSLASDPESMQHLASQLRDCLELPPSAARTLKDVQTQVVRHAHSLNELRETLQETQQEIAAMRTNAEAERSVAHPATENVASASAQDVAVVRAEMQTALQTLQQTHDTLQKHHAALEKQTQRLSEEVKGIMHATEPLPQYIEQLTDQCTALQAAQRQQLPTLQKYVQDVLEVVQENQVAALDPLQLKLRNVEERHKKLQASLEEWTEENAASVAEDEQSRRKKLQQLRADLETHAEAQLSAVREDMTSTQAIVADLMEKVSAIEQQRERDEEGKRQLREDVRAMAQAMKEKSYDPPSAVNVAPSTPEALAITAISSTVPSVTELHSYVVELAGRLSQLEEQTNDSITVTAETLGAFGQQLQDVVTRFALAVSGSEANDVATSAFSSPSSSSAVVAADGGAIKNLEDVFSYLLRQLQHFQQALQRLQANTVETLEILEQHEESTAALPVLQHTVDAIAAALIPLAERLGVDATNLSLQLTSPSHSVDVYPPSHPSSSSSSSSGSLSDGICGGSVP